MRATPDTPGCQPRLHPAAARIYSATATKNKQIILAKGPTTMFYLHGRITRFINVWRTLNLLDPHSNIYFQSTNWSHAFLCFEIHLLATIFKVECARDVTRSPQDNPLVSSRYKTTASPLESTDKCRFIATSMARLRLKC